MKQVKDYLSNFKLGIKTMFKEFFNKDTNKKQRANMWTFSRLVIALIIPILTATSILTNSTPLLIASFGTALFGATTDFFDGRSARKHNSTSEFGKNLDVVADKLFSTSLGVSLSLLNPFFLLNIAGELAIGVTNITYMLKHPEIDIKSSKVGKIKQWPLSAALVLGILSAMIPKLSVITNLAVLTTFSIQMAALANYIETNNDQLKKIELQKMIDEHKQVEDTVTEEKTRTITDEKEELIKLKNELQQSLDETLEEEIVKTRKRTKK